MSQELIHYKILMSFFHILIISSAINEDNKQYILQVLEEYRQLYPDTKKSSLIKDKY